MRSKALLLLLMLGASLLVFLPISPPAKAVASPTLNVHGKCGSAATTPFACTITFTTTANDLILVAETCNGSGCSVPTDNRASHLTYTLRATQSITGGSTDSIAVYSAPDSTGGAITITCNPAGTSINRNSCVAASFSAGGTVPTLDTNSGAICKNGAATSCQVSTSQPDDLLFGFLGCDGEITATCGNPTSTTLTIIDTQNTGTGCTTTQDCSGAYNGYTAVTGTQSGKTIGFTAGASQCDSINTWCAVIGLAITSDGSVSQTMTVTLQNSAPAATVYINGCNPDPANFQTVSSGTGPSVTMLTSCSYTLSFTNTGNSRDIFSESSSATSSAHTTGSDPALTAYEQEKNTFTMTLLAGTTASGLTWTYTGTLLGVGSSTICTISPSAGVTSASCSNVWSDYNRAVTAPADPTGEASNERFKNAANGASTAGTPTNGGNTYTTNYYRQEQATYWENPHIGVGGPTFSGSMNTVLSGTFLGTVSSTICTITTPASPGSTTNYSCSGYADYNTPVTFALVTTANPTNTEWRRDVGATASYSDTAAGQTHPTGASSSGGGTNYDEEFSNTYQFSTNGVGPPQWDSSLAVTPTGTQGGATGQSVCTANPSAGTTTTASCSGYSQYNTPVAAPGNMTGVGTNKRWNFYGSPNSYTDTSGGNTHAAFTYWKQTKNTYQAAVDSGTQTSFDSGLTGPQVIGTKGGTSSTVVCTIIINGGDTLKSCSWYTDYNTQASVGSPNSGTSTLAGAPANSRWLRDTNDCVFTDTVGGATHTCVYYKQYSNTFSAAANAQSTFDAGLGALAISGASSAQSITVCTITPTSGHSSDTCSGYVDGNSSPTIPNTIGTPPANSRWIVSTSSPYSFGAITSGGGTKTANYYKQWTETWTAAANARTTFDATGMTAAVKGQFIGAAATTLCTISTVSGHATDSCGGTVYIDNNQAATFDTDMAGSVPAGERWECATCVTAAQTSGGNTLTINYYNGLSETWEARAQARLIFDASSMTSAVKGQVNGAAGTTICTISTTNGHAQDSCAGYIDYNQAATFDTDFGGSVPANERWRCGTCASSAQTSTSQTIIIDYYNQLTQTYQATPGSPATWDAILSITATGTSLGTGSQTICTITTSNGGGTASCSGYADYNTLVSMLTPVPDGSGIRWAASSPNSWTQTTGGNTNTATYYQQFQNTFTVTPINPTVFDSGRTIILSCYQVNSLVSCATFTPANGAGVQTATFYSDYNQKIVYNCSTGGTAGTAWCGNPGLSSAITTAGGTYNSDYTKYPTSVTTTATFTTGGANKADPPNLLWLLIVPIFFAVLLAIRSKR